MLLCCTIAVVLVACQPEDDVALYGSAKLRVVNTSPEDVQLNVFINDSLLANKSFSYNERSDYLNVSAGQNQIYTTIEGSTVSNRNFPFFLDNNKNYTVFLAGKPSKDSLVYLSVLDNYEAVIDTMATVRFINISPNSPNYNLVFQTNLVDSTNVISSINYRSASSYKRVKPNTYFLRLKKSGSKVSLASLDSCKLQAGKTYTVWAKGLLNTSGTYAIGLDMINDN